MHNDFNNWNGTGKSWSRYHHEKCMEKRELEQKGISRFDGIERLHYNGTPDIPDWLRRFDESHLMYFTLDFKHEIEDDEVGKMEDCVIGANRRYIIDCLFEMIDDIYDRPNLKTEEDCVGQIRPNSIKAQKGKISKIKMQEFMINLADLQEFLEVLLSNPRRMG